MPKDNVLPDVYFGEIGPPDVDWRKVLADAPDPDDEESAVTDPDVVLLLGFDPKELSEEEKQIGILNVLKGGAGSGNFGHSGRPGEVGGSGGEGAAGGEAKIGRFVRQAVSECKTFASLSEGTSSEIAFVVTPNGLAKYTGNKNSISFDRKDLEGCVHFCHSHPNLSSASDLDLHVLLSFPKMKAFDTVLPNGEIHRITKSKDYDTMSKRELKNRISDVVGQFNVLFDTAKWEVHQIASKGGNIDKAIAKASKNLVSQVCKNWGLKFEVIKTGKKKIYEADAKEEVLADGSDIVILDDSLITTESWMSGYEEKK